MRVIVVAAGHTGKRFRGDSCSKPCSEHAQANGSVAFSLHGDGIPCLVWVARAKVSATRGGGRVVAESSGPRGPGRTPGHTQTHVPQGRRCRGVRDRERGGAPSLRYAVGGAGPGEVQGQGPLHHGPKLVVSNWPAYLDPPSKKQKNTLQDFEAATGISVDYTDDVSDNAEFFAKVRNQLGSCQPIGRDLMVLTDWMAAKMIGLGLDPAARRREGAQPAQEPARAPARPPVGPEAHLLRAVADRADRHRLQRQADQGGAQLRGADHQPRPQGQDHPALGDARHHGLHAQGGRRRPQQLHRTSSGSARSRSCTGPSLRVRSAPSPATSTSRT